MSAEEEDDEPGIDFKFDGDTHMGPLAPKHKRRVLDVLKQLVQETIAGEGSRPLEAKLAELQADLDKALLDSEKKTDLRANVEAYNLALDAVEDMAEALEEQNHVRLQSDFAALTEAVAQIRQAGERASDSAG